MILFDDREEARRVSMTMLDADMVPARIKVIGVGGGGGNAVNRMIASNLRGIEFIAGNTDLQALGKCKAQLKLQLGREITRGLGAGADPEVGRKAALEDTERILEMLDGKAAEDGAEYDAAIGKAFQLTELYRAARLDGLLDRISNSLTKCRPSAALTN